MISDPGRNISEKPLCDPILAFDPIFVHLLINTLNLAPFSSTTFKAVFPIDSSIVPFLGLDI